MWNFLNEVGLEGVEKQTSVKKETKLEKKTVDLNFLEQETTVKRSLEEASFLREAESKNSQTKLKNEAMTLSTLSKSRKKPSLMPQLLEQEDYIRQYEEEQVSKISEEEEWLLFQARRAEEEGERVGLGFRGFGRTKRVAESSPKKSPEIKNQDTEGKIWNKSPKNGRTSPGRSLDVSPKRLVGKNLRENEFSLKLNGLFK